MRINIISKFFQNTSQKYLLPTVKVQQSELKIANTVDFVVRLVGHRHVFPFEILHGLTFFMMYVPTNYHENQFISVYVPMKWLLQIIITVEHCLFQCKCQ